MKTKTGVSDPLSNQLKLRAEARKSIAQETSPTTISAILNAFLHSARIRCLDYCHAFAETSRQAKFSHENSSLGVFDRWCELSDSGRTVDFCHDLAASPLCSAVSEAAMRSFLVGCGVTLLGLIAASLV